VSLSPQIVWVWCPTCFSAWSIGTSDAECKTRWGRKVGDWDADENYRCCIFGCMGKMHPVRRMPVCGLKQDLIDTVWSVMRLGGQAAVRELLRDIMTAQDVMDAFYSPLPRLR
jgi:hypothetical protein